MKNKKNRKKYISRYTMGGRNRMYQGGGMYADNTVASAGQGMKANTSSIVYQESDPRLQEERIKSLEDESDRARQQADTAASQAENIVAQGEQQANVDAAEAAMKVQGNLALAKQGLSGIKTMAEGAGMKSKGVNAFAAAKKAYQGAKLAKAATAAQGITEAGIAGAQGAKVAGLAAKGGGSVMSSATTGKTIIVDGAGNLVKAGQAVGKGSALLKGAGAFLKSGAGLGLVASGIGYGVEKLWGDDDPTTTNTAEAAGGVLSGAGTGASIGSFIGPVGTAAGAIIGGIVGGVSKFFGSAKARRAKRRAEREYKRKVAKKVKKANLSTMKGFGSQLAQVRAGETRQKTYSGYDLGRNVAARMGGMRMGMPRYGVAS